MHVKGNWRIRVKGQTQRERESNIIKAEQLFKGGRGEGAGQPETARARGKEAEIAGRLETVFLGIKDLLSGERAEKREREGVCVVFRLDASDRFQRPEQKHFCPCHFNLGLDRATQSDDGEQQDTQTHRHSGASHAREPSESCSEA